MDYKKFFECYRKFFNPIKWDSTVQGIKRIIEDAPKYSINQKQLAYVLATAYHETGFDFVPKKEYGNIKYFLKRYWLNTRLARLLGNDTADESLKYIGRGLVQITGETNYERFGIADNPDKALDLDTAVDILLRGMSQGLFTGKKLSDYINDKQTDYERARRIINGTDKAVIIGYYAERFYQCLQVSQI